jgi:hypothetical protein
MWKFIFDGKYEVSDDGQIRRSAYIKKSGINCEPKLLSQSCDRNGYLKIALSIDNGKPKTFNVHRLIAKAFIGINDGMVVDHIDGDKKNNNISNLRVVTHSENIRAHYDKDKKLGRWISFTGGSSPYRIRRKINNEIKCFGTYKTLEDAIAKRIELFGE